MNIPLGFRFAGVYCGIKKSPEKRDLALIVSDLPAAAAGVFTTNRLAAAPVQACRRRLPSANARGLVVNSGNANACTGESGLADAESMARLLADKIGCDADQTLVSSTGVIGRPLPIEKISTGISAAFVKLGSAEANLLEAANGILTTDTHVKIARRTIETASGKCQILGIAKGAAMIGPNMATMLGYVLTDAKAGPAALDQILRGAVTKSFHCVSVEGHTSTNDSVILIANGASGIEPTTAELAIAVTAICQDLAREIAGDAEGLAHRITIDVTGTRTDDEAWRIAKAVADSALVKTAIFGADPNWGRICSAAGYAGVLFDEQDLSLRLNGTLLYDKGAPVPFDEQTESRRLKENRETAVELVLSLGDGKCRFWTCDLTYDYVRINAEYTT